MFDETLWQAQFDQAAARACEQAQQELSKLKYSEDGVPVVIPILSVKPPSNESKTCEPTIESLIYQRFYEAVIQHTAKDAANPTTNEVANAETIVAMRLFTMQPFCAWGEEMAK